MRRRLWLLDAVVAALAGGPARAAPIATLFNTGVNAAGVVLGSGATDPHWSVVSGPAGAAPAIAGDQSDSKWLASDSVSEWISGGGTNAGSFDYRASFSLAGFDPATASITGTVAADNEITDIRIDGHITGFKLGTHDLRRGRQREWRWPGPIGGRRRRHGRRLAATPAPLP